MAYHRHTNPTGVYMDQHRTSALSLTCLHTSVFLGGPHTDPPYPRPRPRPRPYPTPILRLDPHTCSQEDTPRIDFDFHSHSLGILETRLLSVPQTYGRSGSHVSTGPHPLRSPSPSNYAYAANSPLNPLL
ncbi:hypothetical protein NMY22_g554 [Coprinellus aureogranulatus]|nr:hypothetical protein NMY22_g554 [Coprinellus aureogranulatus]